MLASLTVSRTVPVTLSLAFFTRNYMLPIEMQPHFDLQGCFLIGLIALKFEVRYVLMQMYIVTPGSRVSLDQYE